MSKRTKDYILNNCSCFQEFQSCEEFIDCLSQEFVKSQFVAYLLQKLAKSSQDDMILQRCSRGRGTATGSAGQPCHRHRRRKVGK